MSNEIRHGDVILRARLLPILDLEQAQGYANRSTPQGMRGLATSLAHEALASGMDMHLIEQATELLGLYDDCVLLRPTLMRRLRGWCEGLPIEITGLDEEEEKDELHAAMTSRNTNRNKPAQELRLEDPVTTVKGVGPTLATRLAKLNIETLSDALFYFPTRYQVYDNSTLREISAGQMVSVIGRIVVGSKSRFRFGKHVNKAAIRAKLTDGTAEVELIWWNQWVYNSVDEGALYHLWGAVEQRGQRCFMNNPQLQRIDAKTARQNLDLAARGRLPRHTCIPVYRLAAGLTNAFMRKLIGGLLAGRLHQQLNDPLSGELRQRYDLPSLWITLKMMHQPADEEEWTKGRKRMAFQALYDMHIRMRASQQDWSNQTAPRMESPVGFLDGIP